MKYKGKYVDFQRVRAKKSPKIEMMGESDIQNSKSKEGAADVVNKEAFIPTSGKDPIAPEWEMQLINHDDEVVEFDGFNLNYNEAKCIILTFKMPYLVTGTLNL